MAHFAVQLIHAHVILMENVPVKKDILVLNVMNAKLVIIVQMVALAAQVNINTVCQNKGPTRCYENRKIQRSFQGSFG